jgi:hypothetical protein
MVRAVASARAASWGKDVVAVTLDWVIDRIALCRPTVNDSSSAVTGAGAWPRRARAPAASLAATAAVLARTSWVPQIQAQNSWITSRGAPEPSTGPDVRSPAPVIVALSCPNVVSEAGQRSR